MLLETSEHKNLTKEYITDRLLGGMTVTEIGAEFGYAYTRMRKICESLGVSRDGYQARRGARQRRTLANLSLQIMPDVEKAGIVDLLKSGRPVKVRTKEYRKKLKMVSGATGLPINHQRADHDWDKINKLFSENAASIYSIEDASNLTMISAFRLNKFSNINDILSSKALLTKDEIIGFIKDRELTLVIREYQR